MAEMQGNVLMASGLEITAGQLRANDENWLTMFSRSLLGSAGGLIGLSLMRMCRLGNHIRPQPLLLLWP